MGLDIAFWILALVTVVAGLGVVLLRNVFRAALSMVLCFFMVAGIYVTMGADFLAAVQVIIYVGAISVLILLAVMLTREVWKGNLANKLRAPAAIVVLLLGGTLVFTLLHGSWEKVSPTSPQPTTAALGIQLMGEDGFILPMEIAAAVLLAAIIGAIVLVREK